MSNEWNHNGDHPQVSPGAYVHPTALLVGNVRVDTDAFVGPYAVVRADEAGPDGTVLPIAIGAGSNVQDGVLIHALGGTGVRIGAGSSIAHGAVVHGPCEIGNECFVGFRSVVYASGLGEGVAVMHGCVIERVELPPRCHVTSGAIVREPDTVSSLASVDNDTRDFMDRVRDTNIELVRWRVNRKDHC